MPGRGTPWRGVGKGQQDRIGTGEVKDDSLLSEDIKDGTIQEVDLDSALQAKVNAGGGGAWSKIKDEAMSGNIHTVTFSPAIDLTATDLAMLRFIIYVGVDAGFSNPGYRINGQNTLGQYTTVGPSAFKGDSGGSPVRNLNISGGSAWFTGDEYPVNSGQAVDTIDLFAVNVTGGVSPTGWFNHVNQQSAFPIYVQAFISFKGSPAITSLSSFSVDTLDTTGNFLAGSRILVYRLDR